MVSIKLFELVGEFAENKDIARDIRISKIVPALEMNEKIILDFEGIEAATQSFVHALLSSLIRDRGSEVLDSISFKNCNETLKKIIGIVVEYMQESV